MFDFLIRKSAVNGAQKAINKLPTKVNVHVPPDLPLPSVGIIKKHAITVARINELEPVLEKLSDDELRNKTTELKEKYQQTIDVSRTEYEQLQDKFYKTINQQERDDLVLQVEKSQENFRKTKQQFLNDILPEAFAVVREAGKRVLGMRHYDVQLVGGMVLNGGNIAEMTTGEGKTLCATLPAYLNGLTAEGVHIVTVNDYLARRDRDWMGPLFEFLGLSVGVIQHDMDPQRRKKEYGCDITYGTNNEFGFDYLRDNMVSFKEDMVQRVHHFAIVDEVDSILIDEARTPLIISGPAEESTDKYYRAYEITKKLKGRRVTEKDEIDAKHKEINLADGFDYLADEKAKSISLTEDGETKAAEYFGVENIHDMETIEYRHHILQALKAKEFFVIDVDYVVKDKQVIIVDEFTGRMMPGRRWSDGLHQAVEAKEGIKIERENQTLATITFQNYFRLYEKLSGMTGTADTEATEFKTIYNLDVVVMPTNKPLQRKNYADCIYRSIREKFIAVVEEIEEHYKRGQPVLVGTISIEKSELLSKMLTQKGVKHKVLNAKFHESEANIIAQAGRYQAVTIATNMAGRGTDIVLGGNPEFLAKSLMDQNTNSDSDEREQQETFKKFMAQFKQQCKEEHQKVIEVGGLHVLGTERHESRRIDNQLRGRQGRQGDPGSSRFYVSLEDDLMRLFASDRIIGVMDKLGMEEGQVLEHPWLSKALENAQRRVETHNFEIRKHLLEYDDVMNKQREVIYNLRRSILESDNVYHVVEEAVSDTIYNAVGQHLFSEGEEEVRWDFEGLLNYLQTNFGLNIEALKDKLPDMSKEEIVELLVNRLNDIYKIRETEIGIEQLRHMEKMVVLNTIDSKWKDHLYGMDQLKDGVGLRSYGQRNPIIEYKREGFDMFQMMYASINQEIAEIIYKIQPAGTNARVRGVFSSLPQKMIHQEAAGFQETMRQQAPAVSSGQSQQVPRGQSNEAPRPIRNESEKVGRNDPCSCGSGKKYKKCCGK